MFMLIFTEDDKRLVKSFISLCNNNHLKINISKTNEHRVY